MSASTSPHTIVVAGSTARTLQCAQALVDDPRFEVTGVLTPGPTLIGRKQVPTKNPLHLWAEEHAKKTVLIERRIDESTHQAISSELQAPGILLVVDFGYIVPQWLLDWPVIAPINIHPSALPKYRGSSPGQFVLVFGEKESAVTVMMMDAKLDHGPIIHTVPFAVENTWIAADYYTHAFTLLTPRLADILSDFAASYQLSTVRFPSQPDDSPTPIARQLKREDGYIPLDALQSILSMGSSTTPIPFLSSYQLPALSYRLYCMWRGFHPWPGLWTLARIKGEEKRVKLLQFHMEGDRIILDQIQIEGKAPQAFEGSLLTHFQLVPSP